MLQKFGYSHALTISPNMCARACVCVCGLCCEELSFMQASKPRQRYQRQIDDTPTPLSQQATCCHQKGICTNHDKSRGSERNVLRAPGQTDQVCSTAGKQFLLGNVNARVPLGSPMIKRCRKMQWATNLCKELAHNINGLSWTLYTACSVEIGRLGCPYSKHWHLIDFVITRRKDRPDVRETMAMAGADCWTDNRLLVSKLTIHIPPKRRPQGKEQMKRLNVDKL